VKNSSGQDSSGVGSTVVGDVDVSSTLHNIRYQVVSLQFSGLENIWFPLQTFGFVAAVPKKEAYGEEIEL